MYRADEYIVILFTLSSKGQRLTDLYFDAFALRAESQPKSQCQRILTVSTATPSDALFPELCLSLQNTMNENNISHARGFRTAIILPKFYSDFSTTYNLRKHNKIF